MWSIYVETESCVSSSVCAACNRVDTPRRSGSCSLSRHSRCSRSSHSCPSGDCRRSAVAFPDTVPAPSAVCRQPWKLRRREVGEEQVWSWVLISVWKSLLTHLSAAWHVHVSDSPVAVRHSWRGTWPAAARVYASLSWFQSKFHFKKYIGIYFVQLAGILYTIWDLFSYFFIYLFILVSVLVFFLSESHELSAQNVLYRVCRWGHLADFSQLSLGASLLVWFAHVIEFCFWFYYYYDSELYNLHFFLTFFTVFTALSNEFKTWVLPKFTISWALAELNF